MSADNDGRTRRGDWAHLDLGDVVVLALPVEIFASHQALDDLDHFIHALAAGFPILATGLEVFDPGAEPNAQNDSLIGQCSERAHLLRRENRVANRKLQDAEGEFDVRRHDGHCGEELEGIEEGCALEEGAIAVCRIGVGAFCDFRIEDAVA
jgi:hypothetical protein